MCRSGRQPGHQPGLRGAQSGVIYVLPSRGRLTLAGLAGPPNHLTTTRLGVEEHHGLLREIPRGRFASGGAPGATCQPILQDLDHRADRSASLDRERAHEKVDSSTRVGRPPLPQPSLARTARRAEIVKLPSEHGRAEISMRLSPVRWKPGGWNTGVERPDIEILDASVAVEIVESSPLREYYGQPARAVLRSAARACEGLVVGIGLSRKTAQMPISERCPRSRRPSRGHVGLSHVPVSHMSLRSNTAGQRPAHSMIRAFASTHGTTTAAGQALGGRGCRFDGG